LFLQVTNPLLSTVTDKYMININRADWLIFLKSHVIQGTFYVVLLICFIKRRSTSTYRYTHTWIRSPCYLWFDFLRINGNRLVIFSPFIRCKGKPFLSFFFKRFSLWNIL